MKIDFNKIEQSTGRKFDNAEQLYFYVKYVIEFLKVNNKNYTKKQYYKIDELFDIVNAIQLEEVRS